MEVSPARERVMRQDAHWIREHVTKCTAWPENPAMKEEHKVNNIRRRGEWSHGCGSKVRGALFSLIIWAVPLKTATCMWSSVVLQEEECRSPQPVAFLFQVGVM